MLPHILTLLLTHFLVLFIPGVNTFRLYCQKDGNVVLYHNNKPNKNLEGALWTTDTKGKDCQLKFNEDHILELHDMEPPSKIPPKRFRGGPRTFTTFPGSGPPPRFDPYHDDEDDSMDEVWWY